MGRIQSSVGLVTGLDITGTVNQLMQVAAQPRALLSSRTEQLKQQQVAIGEITALTIGLQLAARNLGQDATFDARTATSSASTKLAATITGTPAAANYQFTPKQLAQTHHLLGTGLADTTTALGAGAFSFHLEGDAAVRAVTIDADDTLADLVEKINAVTDGGVAASIVNDGSGATPYRLSLVSKTSGEQGEIVVDAAPPGIAFTEVVAAQNAKLVLGDPDTGVEIQSATNDFTDVVEGVKLTLLETSETPISVTIATSDSSLVSRVKLFVDQYNKLQDKVGAHTRYDATTSTAGILLGSSELLRVGSVASDFVSGRIFGAGSIQAVSELGLNLDQNGKLSLDEAKLKARFAADPAAVRTFFAQEETGFAARIDAALDELSGEGNSLLLSRTAALQRRIEANNERLAAWDTRLARQRETLLTQFYNLELAIGKLKNNLTAIATLTSVANSFASSTNSSS